MKITNDCENLVYDDDNPLCSMNLSSCQSKLFAFITCLDVGMPHCRHKTPEQKQYWGLFSWEDKEASIKAILATGGKWPELRRL